MNFKIIFSSFIFLSDFWLKKTEESKTLLALAYFLVLVSTTVLKIIFWKGANDYSRFSDLRVILSSMV